VAVPGVAIGRRDQDAGVTNGTVAVPVVTRVGFAWILRDAQALLHRAGRRMRANWYGQLETPHAR
jgi:hypothetical protein